MQYFMLAGAQSSSFRVNQFLIFLPTNIFFSAKKQEIKVRTLMGIENHTLILSHPELWLKSEIINNLISSN